jgi:signal transduction histidine kinase
VLLGWSIAAIDLEFVRQELVPELVELHLAGPEGLEYQVRVASRSSPRQIIYDSDTGLGADAFSSADLATGLLAMTWEPMGRPRAPEMEIRRPPRGGGPEMRRRAATPWFGRGEDAGRWELRVKHRLGSLDAAVNRVRHRNLAISFAVLLLMGGAMGMLVVSTRRAQRLARLQMQFVAGVSHELRTPLAVICSAGDNLADGVVAGREQAQRYGAVVRNEGRRLAQMVEQILGFAGIQAGRAKYEMRPVPVAELVERALAACGAGLEESGCRIEQEIQPGLPPVEADATALAHCLRNLISNALQYGREGKWLGIRAKAGAGGKVEIRVEDRGAGIDAADLPHIFEPFYRGKRAIAAQIHGNGLGLSLVQHIVEAHRGSIHVASTPGKGTCFTVTLPAAEAGAGAAG